jgi:hypothetical protein
MGGIVTKKKKQKDKKPSKASPAKLPTGLKALAENPLLADIVAAALVATASALKDSKRARALASDTGDELGRLAAAGSERGNALWDMAVQIGRRSLDALNSETKPRKTKGQPGSKKPGKKKQALAPNAD